MIYDGDEVRMTGANDPDCFFFQAEDGIRDDDEVVHPVAGYTRKREKNAPDKNLLAHYKKLIDIRNRYKALRRGDLLSSCR